MMSKWIQMGEDVVSTLLAIRDILHRIELRLERLEARHGTGTE